jgi:hypothetical protein
LPICRYFSGLIIHPMFRNWRNVPLSSSERQGFLAGRESLDAGPTCRATQAGARSAIGLRRNWADLIAGGV